MNINQIQGMKGTGEKSAALVVWDAPTAHIAHECGADFLSLVTCWGNLWGHSNNLETLDDFPVAVKAVREGHPMRLCVQIFPTVPCKSIPRRRSVPRSDSSRGGADLGKIDAAPDFPEAVTAVTRAGVPVFAQMGLSPQWVRSTGLALVTYSNRRVLFLMR